MKKYSITILVLFASQFLVASNPDSLIQVLKTKIANDTTKANLLADIGHILQGTGSLSEATKYMERAISMADSLHFKRGLSHYYNWMAVIQKELGNYPKAIEQQLLSIKLSEELNDKFLEATAYINLGNIFFNKYDFPKAAECTRKALHIALENKMDRTAASCYGNIAISYNARNQLDSAEYYYKRALNYYEKYGPLNELAAQYSNIGVLKWDLKKYDDALAFLRKALHAQEKVGNKMNIAAALINMGEIYVERKDFKTGIPILHEALKIAIQSQSKGRIMETYQSLSQSYSLKGDHQKSVEYFEKYISIKDTLMNQKSNKNINEMETRFETDKKQQEIELLQKDKSIRELQMGEQQANINRQRIIIYSVIGGLALIITLIIFILKSYREKRKINIGLERKNIEINRQKNQIEEKNILITDSIDYARNIQNAILPSDEIIQKYIPESFVLFLPKDIVSGDFYWLSPLSRGKETGGEGVLLAAVDCTGHGVPGAFMSVMAFNMLENIIAEKKIYQPSLILDELNKVVIEILHQESETSSVKYGMDIALVSLSSPAPGMRAQYAGAHNPLCIVRNNELIEIKADKTTIGMAKEKFINYSIEVQKGDMLYIFTDGYADQKGGPNNKKFFAPSFKELLISISKTGMDQQRKIILDTFNDWKKDREQFDDVLVMGVRI